MQDTIYYRTFPLSKPSPNSVCMEAPMNSNAKRRARMNSISLGPPAKIQKREDEDTTTTTATLLATATRTRTATRTATATTPWICPSSIKASRTRGNNSIQEIIKPIIEEIKPGYQRTDKKDPISLATADSSLSHIPPCTKAMEAIVRAVLRKPHTASYTHACGALDARRAIAAHHSVPGHPPLDPEHVIVTNGCSGALELVLASLLDPGTSLLVPQPGFPLYEEIAVSNGANVMKYRLDPTRNWECDMDHLEEILSESSRNKNNIEIRAMVINNPSSHGAVFSEKHLLELLDFALKHRLLIVSDEVYGDLTFGNNTFHPLAVVAGPRHGSQVPVITTSGLSKQFLVPGWRIGWATFQDNVWGSLHDIEAGARKLATLQHGCVSHLQQSAIPTLLSPNTQGLTSWKEQLRATLDHQARFLCSELDANCNGLAMLSPPQGSMYTILRLDLDYFCHSSSSVVIANDVDFCRELVREENVFVLPGSSFGVPNTIRVAFSANDSILEQASSRIAEFCRRHTTREEAVVLQEVVPQQQRNETE